MFQIFHENKSKTTTYTYKYYAYVYVYTYMILQLFFSLTNVKSNNHQHLTPQLGQSTTKILF